MKRGLKAERLRMHKEWADKVKERDGYKCFVCGKEDKLLNAHHLLPKERYPSLKYDVLNGISLCVRHHKFGKCSPHLDPIPFFEVFRAKKPTIYAYLVNKSSEYQV